MSIPVIIYPVLNRFDLLSKSLASIDHEVDEILIINNSTVDSNTDNLKEEFPHLNLRIVNLPSNQGIAGSWNLGIKFYPWAPYWLIGSADTSFLPGTLEKFEQMSGPTNFVKSTAAWSCFSLGEEVVKRVGLFDEYIYPAYFEDNDYEDRMNLAGVNVISQDLPQVDDSGGSQTIKSDKNYQNKNYKTFELNKDYYNQKKASGDYSTKGWDLHRRRKNEWIG